MHLPRWCVITCDTHASCTPQAISKSASNRNEDIVKGFGFLAKYASLRGIEQETAYNLGRAYHALNVKEQALRHYEDVRVCNGVVASGCALVVDCCTSDHNNE